MQSKTKKTFGILALIVFIVAMGIAWVAYRLFYADNIKTPEEHLYIKTGWTFEDLMQHIEENNILKHPQDFERVAKMMEYDNRVRPGRYRLSSGTGNRQLIRNLRLGLQEPLKLRFENVRLREQLAGILADQLEPDSLEFLNLLRDEEVAEKFGFNHDNFFNMFIPNTYELYWNTSAEKFVERMHQEYQRFWTSERLKKAEQNNLTANQVGVLASIVQGEALHRAEMPKIAGLYMNRLRKGMLLQADPTVIFAHQDFTMRRVLFKHLQIDSPYNTYKYAGLPPGPIMMPSIAAIDAVLNHENHAYIYMCAKDDFSGYHNFAVTAAEHAVNARKFQQALNERNIRN